MDERELLLLGLLRRQQMHGYQLNQFLEHRLEAVLPMKRSTAYSLLARLARQGLVEQETERVGRRPERRVYGLTPQGEAAFLQGLRLHLAQEGTSTVSGAVPLLFLDMLPAQEVRELLGRRLEAVRARRSGEEERLHLHAATPARWALEHRLAHVGAEERWLEEAIAALEGEALSASVNTA